MKTLKKGGETARFEEDKVAKAVKDGWTFAPKSEWKKVRDAGKKPEKKPEKDAK